MKKLNSYKEFHYFFKNIIKFHENIYLLIL